MTYYTNQRGIPVKECTVLSAKLTPEMVIEIRQKWNKGQGEETYSSLAKIYSVDQSTIYKCCHRKTWRHVP